MCSDCTSNDNASGCAMQLAASQKISRWRSNCPKQWTSCIQSDCHNGSPTCLGQKLGQMRRHWSNKTSLNFISVYIYIYIHPMRFCKPFWDDMWHISMDACVFFAFEMNENWCMIVALVIFCAMNSCSRAIPQPSQQLHNLLVTCEVRDCNMRQIDVRQSVQFFSKYHIRDRQHRPDDPRCQYFDLRLEMKIDGKLLVYVYCILYIYIYTIILCNICQQIWFKVHV